MLEIDHCKFDSGRTNLDLVPVLSSEGIRGLLLETLLALGEALVPVVVVSLYFLEPHHCTSITVAMIQVCIDSGIEAVRYHSLSDSHDCDVMFRRWQFVVEVWRKELSGSGCSNLALWVWLLALRLPHSSLKVLAKSQLGLG